MPLSSTLYIVAYSKRQWYSELFSFYLCFFSKVSIKTSVYHCVFLFSSPYDQNSLYSIDSFCSLRFYLLHIFWQKKLCHFHSIVELTVKVYAQLSILKHFLDYVSEKKRRTRQFFNSIELIIDIYVLFIPRF